MRIEDSISILKKLIFFIIILFLLFVMAINIIKFLNFSIKINSAVKTYENNENVDKINYNRNDISYSPLENMDKKHSAEELGFHNDLYSINGGEWGDGINILLVGSDNRDNDLEKSRADVIIILRILNSGKILTISIPRDTLIKINTGKWKGKTDKIGHSLYWGGLDNLKESVEKLLASSIHRTAIINNFNSFEAFVAVLGGINIDKTLDGKIALQWIRNRNFRDGDIERCKRQEIFLKKAVIKTWGITNNGDYFYSYLFFKFLKKIIETDLTQKDFKNIFYILKKNKFNPEKDFYIGVLPGNFKKYDSPLLKRKNLDGWKLDDDVLSNLQFLFYTEKSKNEHFLNNEVNLLNFLKIDFTNFIKNATTSK